MSDLETLLVTFQTQLSDVMETVVKTAMYEVIRLVEDGFLKEVKRRGQEVESLRMQLQWTEKKLGDQGGKEGKKTGRCVSCAKKDVELSTDAAEGRSNDQQEDVLKKADMSPASPSPERQLQVTAEEELGSAVDVKEEVNKPSCSSAHVGAWSGGDDSKVGLESPSPAEMTEAQPKQTPESSEELLRNIIKQGPQISSKFSFPNELETHMTTDPSLKVDSCWAGRMHRLRSERNNDPGKTRGSVKCTEHNLGDSVTVDVHAEVVPGRDQNSMSGTSKTIQQNNTLGVTIKQEVTVDSDECEESDHVEKDRTTKTFLSSVKQQRLSSAAHKQNRISHKAVVQEVMKLHPKANTGLKLQAAIQHLHRPMRKNPHSLSHHGATAALSVAHSQLVNLNPLNRIPSTSKAAAPSLSAQRVHLGNKQAAALNRTGASWIGIRAQHQSVNSHHASPTPHPDTHISPRHLLRCGQCGKCFPHPSNLKAHLQTHTGERPFCCSLCGRSFTKLSNLKAHRRVHTGERPYCCLACGKRFTQKCNLKRHQRIHLDV